MTSLPEFTIIIPVRNRAEIVGRTLQSIAGQTQPPAKTVLVDNGSTDHTLRVLRQWAESQRRKNLDAIVVEETKPGASAARNRGLEEAATPYVMFFDSDDTMAPGHCASVAEALRRLSGPDILGWDTTYHRLDGSTRTFRFPEYGDVMFTHLFHSCLATQRYTARTELIRRVGAWDETLPAWNDYELGTRLLLATGDVRKMLLPRNSAPTVDIYSTAESITGTKLSSLGAGREAALDACDRALRRAGRTRELVYTQLRRVILAGTYRKEGETAEAERLLSEVLSATASARRRTTFKVIYRYVAAGGRGVAHAARFL